MVLYNGFLYSKKVFSSSSAKVDGVKGVKEMEGVGDYEDCVS